MITRKRKVNLAPKHGLIIYLYITLEKAKKFLEDFYADSDEGKVFTYAEQLVWAAFNVVVKLLDSRQIT